MADAADRIDDGDEGNGEVALVCGLRIRDSHQSDLEDIEALYPLAFPDEDLVPLVKRLLSETPGVVSLIGMVGDQVAAHLVFTFCELSDERQPFVLLGPLGVSPDNQGKGIGSAMVQYGIDRLEREGVAGVFVLGDPAYYRRFGFCAEEAVKPPYPLPVEWQNAWQFRSLNKVKRDTAGTMMLPAAWQDPALWTP